jgi:hypothetical protein
MHIFVGSDFMGSYRLRYLLELKSTRRISTSYFAARLTITTPTTNSGYAGERNALIFERFIRRKFLSSEQLFRPASYRSGGSPLTWHRLLTLYNKYLLLTTMPVVVVNFCARLNSSILQQLLQISGAATLR